MRVITGIAKGKKLQTLQGDDVRPTIERIKESIFSMIQFQVQGRKFLDLFSGSGQMGIEALSRQAKSATFIDFKKQSIDIIKSNLKLAGLIENAIVLNQDSIQFLRKTREKFDIVFLDPPYKTRLLQEALKFVPNVVNLGGAIICENPIDQKLEHVIGEFMLEKYNTYGKIAVSIYRHKDVII